MAPYPESGLLPSSRKLKNSSSWSDSCFDEWMERQRKRAVRLTASQERGTSKHYASER